jgi:hypothetical protein
MLHLLLLGIYRQGPKIEIIGNIGKILEIFEKLEKIQK